MQRNFALANLVQRLPYPLKTLVDDASEAMPEDFCPTPNHVCCGRGKIWYEHNQAFRTLVDSHLEEYSAAPSKLEKSRIVTSVFDEVNMRGGFVRQDSKSKLWHSVPEVMAREKISQAFRDCLTMQYKSSKDFRQLQRKQARNELQKMESGSEEAPTSKKMRPSLPSTTLSTSDALKQLLLFSQNIAKNTVVLEAPTQKEKRFPIVAMEIPGEMPSFHSFTCSGPRMMHRRGSISDISLSLSFGDLSEESLPTSPVSLAQLSRHPTFH
jgi:hypothetical protein